MKTLLKNMLYISALGASFALFGCTGDDDTGDDDTNLPEVGGTCSNALNWEVWVPRQEANDLRVIDGPRFTVTDMLDFGSTGLVGPHNVHFSADEKYAFFAMLGTEGNAYADGGVNIVDTETKMVVASVVTNAKTHQVGITPNGQQAWAVNVNNDTISIIDLSGGVANATISDVITVGATGGPLVAKFSPDGSKAYVTNKGVVDGKSSVSVFNTSSLAKDGTDYVTGEVTTEMALTADGDTLYVTNGGSNNVEKIDLTAADRSGAVTEFAGAIGGSHSVVLAKKTVIVTGRSDGQVLFYDGNGTQMMVFDIMASMGNAQPDIVNLSPSCARAYVAEKTGGALVELDVDKMEIKNTLDLGGGVPHGVAVKSAPSDM